MTESSLTIRKRGAKVNAKQKKILLQFMADNPLIFTRKITTDFTIEHHKAFWQNMSAVLNIFGPPRKTVESWKKAWKDIRLRYRKIGVDLKELLGTLKYENVVNTKYLLEKADQISTSTRGKGDVEQILRETVFGGIENPEFLHDMDIPQTNNKSASQNDISNMKLQVDEEVFGLASDNEDSRAESTDDRNEKSEDNSEDLCEIAYEEVLESDLEDLSESDSLIPQSDSSSKRKIHSKPNGVVLNDDSDSETESQKKNKKLKLNTSQCTKTPISHCQNEEESRKDASSSLLTDLLLELRQHNKIQSEKLTLKKKHYEQKKRLLEQSLSTKKDIAKAHIALAKSVKTFVDSISFNT